MHIPTSVGQGNETNAGLHKATSKQHASTRGVAAVTIPNGVRLFIDVKRESRFFRTDHRVRSLIERIQGVERIRLFFGSEVIINHIQHLSTFFETGKINTARQVQISNLKVSIGGIRSEGKCGK